MLEFWTIREPIAKKDHVCDLCGERIRTGERYVRFSGKYDGWMFDHKHHIVCDRLIKEYCDWVGDNEYDPDSVLDMIRERVCWNCNHYNEDLDDFEDIDCNPCNCKRVIAELLKDGASGMPRPTEGRDDA